MTQQVKISYEQSGRDAVTVRAKIEAPQCLPFVDLVGAVRSHTTALTTALIEARERADTETALTMHKHICAVCVELVSVAEGRKQEWLESSFRFERCAVDWRRWCAIDTLAPCGEIPRPGQAGDFRIEVNGFTYAVSYSPHDWISDHDGFSFQHVVAGERVCTPCPLTKTGFHSTYVDFTDVDELGCVAAVARAYMVANSTVPASVCNQYALL